MYDDGWPPSLYLLATFFCTVVYPLKRYWSGIAEPVKEPFQEKFYPPNILNSIQISIRAVARIFFQSRHNQTINTYYILMTCLLRTFMCIPYKFRKPQNFDIMSIGNTMLELRRWCCGMGLARRPVPNNCYPCFQTYRKKIIYLNASLHPFSVISLAASSFLSFPRCAIEHFYDIFAILLQCALNVFSKYILWVMPHKICRMCSTVEQELGTWQWADNYK